MFREIIKEIELENGVERTMFDAVAKIYDDYLPKSLSMNQYELSENFGFEAEQWKKFFKIKEVERAIEVETAGLAEIAARKALERLRSGNAASADIQAAKELLANSKLIKQKTKQPQQVIITRIPEKRERP